MEYDPTEKRVKKSSFMRELSLLNPLQPFFSTLTFLSLKTALICLATAMNIYNYLKMTYQKIVAKFTTLTFTLTSIGDVFNNL